jgi:hypothetical protein
MSTSNVIAWHLGLIPREVREDYGTFDSIFCALPSYIGSFLTLAKFSKANVGFRGYVNEKLLDVDRYLYKLKLPCDVTEATKDDIFHAKVTLGTHPGITTRKLADRAQSGGMSKVKRVTKTNLLFWVINDLYNSWDFISSGKVGKTIGTYCVGSREKIQKAKIGDPIESRPLWIPEMCDVILGSTWLEVLKNYWQAHGLFKSEIWLGHSDTKMRYYRRLELDVRYKYSYEFDGQVWDSSVLPQLVIKAFNIYASCFVKSKAVANHFKFICDTFIMKRVVLHNGNSFLVWNGVPSGHAWTAHINSMVNWIIWTSTINYCPHIPRSFKEDYELQILGDDVCIHSNTLLKKDVRHLISRWMLREFNYVAVDDTNQPCKSKVKTSNQASSFLKRYIDSKGNLDTKTKDIWKKLIFGADYSGTRKSRMTYLYRRVNDLAITSEKELRRVSLYMSFIDNFERFFFNLSYNERISRQKTVYDLLFTFTTGFTNNIRQVWTKFIPLVRFNLFEINQRSEHFYKYLKSVYRQNYWTYDTKREYVDYWVERKQSVTVSKALRNIKEVQIICDVSIFKKLHGPFVKNGKR